MRCRLNSRLVLFLLLMIINLTARSQQFEKELQLLIEAAYNKDAGVQVNNIRKEQLSIDLQSTRFNYLPKLSANATYTRLNDDIRFPSSLNTLLIGTQGLLVKEAVGIPFNNKLPESVKLQAVPPVQEKNILKATIKSQWLLFSGFKIENLTRAIEHHQKSISFLNQGRRTKIIAEVSDHYDRLALLAASDRVINSSSRMLAEQKRFVNKAIENGLATPLERKKIELAEQKLLLKIEENEHNRILLSEKLSQLTGMDLSDIKMMELTLYPLLVDEGLEEKERPEINSLNEAIQSTRFVEKAAYSEYIPKVAAFAQYEMLDNDLSMFDPKWYAGIRLQWNLFDGFNARNNGRKAALERRTFELRKQDAQELIQLGKIKSGQALKHANLQIGMMQSQVALANETMELVRKQYANGLTTITELLNALNELERAKFELHQSFYMQRRAAVEYVSLRN